MAGHPSFHLGSCGPPLPHRVEDGAGTCSTARPLPVSPDPLSSLRSAWSKRLLDTGLVSVIATKLNSGDRRRPSLKRRCLRSWKTFGTSFVLMTTPPGKPC